METQLMIETDGRLALSGGSKKVVGGSKIPGQKFMRKFRKKMKRADGIEPTLPGVYIQPSSVHEHTALMTGPDEEDNNNEVIWSVAAGVGTTIPFGLEAACCL
jgi:hypothetical protein